MNFIYIKQDCETGKLYIGVEMCQENATGIYTGVNSC